MVKMIFKKTKTKNLKFFLLGIIILIVSSVFVSAFGVGFVGSKLNLYSGQVFDTAFSLQNVDEGALVVEVSVEEGAEYISLTGGTRFEVPKGSNTAVPVKISVPNDTNIGDKYTIKVLFRPISGDLGKGGNGTTIGFAIGQSRTIDIEVIENPEEKPAPEEGISIGWVILAIVLVIAIIAVVWFVIKNKKEK